MQTESVDPILYTEQINAQRDIYLQQFKVFNTSYSKYVISPTTDNQTLFSTSITNLKTTSQNIYNITTNIQTSAIGLAEYNDYSNLSEIKDENDALTNSFLQAENVKNGSKTMIHDTKIEYNYQYYKNVQLFIGIIAIIGLSTKIFSGK
jgi:hypothetical protein